MKEMEDEGNRNSGFYFIIVECQNIVDKFLCHNIVDEVG